MMKIYILLMIIFLMNNKEVFFRYYNIVIPATNLAKTVAKTSYSLIEYLHGMPEGSGSSPLGSISIFAAESF